MKKTCMWMSVAFVLLLISGCMGTKQQTEGNQQAGKEEKGQVQAKETKQTHQIEVAEIDKQNWIQQKEPVALPILMYHSISSGNSLRVPMSEFAAHMK